LSFDLTLSCQRTDELGGFINSFCIKTPEMPPKKRDKDNETNKNSKIDHLQADHELFLQAFESKFLLDC
jgi:hypothetical protein